MLLQSTLSLIILALTSTVTNQTSYNHSLPIFALFVATCTFVIIAWRVLAVLKYPVLYNRLAVLILEIVLVAWWLTAFAGLATWSARYAWLEVPVCTVDATGRRYCIYRRDPGQLFVVERAAGVGGLGVNGKRYRDMIAAAASLSALQL